MIRQARPDPPPASALPPSAGPLEATVVGGVLVLVALATAFFGGVQPWQQPVFLVVAAVLCGAAVIGWRGRRAAYAVAPLLVLATLAAVQITPLPFALVDAFSPERAANVTRYAGVTPEYETLSYYAPETRRALARLLIAAAVFGSVAVGVRSDRGVKRLLAGLATIGLLEAGLALAQVASDAPGIYWDSALSGGVWVGSFVNHSNFAQAINAAIGAGLGLLLVRMAEDRRRGDPRIGGGASGFLQRQGGLLIGLAVGAVALAAALSRGGLLAAGFASAAVVLALHRRGGLGSKGWALFAAPLVAFAALVLTDFDPVYERLGTLGAKSSYADRVELSLATVRTGAAHPLTGVGLDAHRFAFPAYDTTDQPSLAEQADNDHAQLFEEAGVVGVLAMAGFLAVVAGSIRDALRTKSPARYAAYATLYALVAALVHSVTDFGQRLPAVFCSSAALAGLAVALATPSGPAGPNRPSRLRIGIVALTLPVWGALLWQAIIDYQAERWWAQAYGSEQRLRITDWQGPPQDFVDLITASEQAHRLRPADIDYAFWLNVYRWQGFNLAGAGGAADEPSRREVAGRIAESLAEARRGCPTYGPVHTLEGQVRLTLDDPAAFELLENGAELAKHDPAAFYAAAVGEMLRDPPRPDEGREWLRRAARLSPHTYTRAAELALDLFDDFALAEELADDQTPALGRLAEVAAERERYAAEAARIRQTLAGRIAIRIASGEATTGELLQAARQAATDGDLTRAIDLYRRCLSREYNRVDWRLRLCDLLERQGRYSEALREAKLASRLRPGAEEVRRRIERLSVAASSEPRRLDPPEPPTP